MITTDWALRPPHLLFMVGHVHLGLSRGSRPLVACRVARTRRATRAHEALSDLVGSPSPSVGPSHGTGTEIGS